MKPRPYQIEAIEGIREAFNSSNSVLAVLATGLGKTIIASMLSKEMLPFGKTLFLAHREELIYQAARKLYTVTGVEPAIEMGFDHVTDQHEYQPDIIVSTIQTQISGMGGNGRMTKFDPDRFSLLIVDECFPAGTMIDGRPIETIRVGDFVSSFNHSENKIEQGRVSNLFRRSTNRIAIVTLSDGQKIKCTPNHPIFTLRGYIPAGILTSNDVVLTTIYTERNTNETKNLRCLRSGIHSKELEQLHGSNMLREMQACETDGKSKKGDSELLSLRPGNHARRPEWAESCKKRECPLLSRVQVGAFPENHSGNLCQSRRSNHAVPENKRYESPGSTSVGLDEVASDGLETAAAWGQRRVHSSTAIDGLCVGLADGSGNSDTILPEGWVSESVQSGYREYRPEDCDRGGREQPQDYQGQSTGFKERFGLASIGVESVEILEQGRSERFEQLCPKGIVYNLEVDSNHNYFADGVLVHNCHHAAASSYRKVIDYYSQNPELKILGVTATPDRADEEALGQIFDTVAYEYGIREAIEDGWLVPIEQRAVFVKGIDLSQVRTTAGDLNGADLAEVMEEEQNLHEVASPTLELTGDKKTLVFAASVRQAERLTEILNRHKENCARFVYAKTDKEVRREMLKDYRDGKFQYLVNVGITTEGFDEPSIEVIVMARPTKSRSLFAQMSGRGTRALTGVLDDLETAEERKEAIAYSGKPKLEIIDFVGNSGRHKLVSTADILGGKYSDEVVKRAKENIEKSDKSEDVLIELDKAEQQLLAEMRRKEEAARRANLKLKAQYKTTKINPFDVLDIIPARERAWHRGRLPSQKQTDLLEKFGVNPEGLSFTSASQLIGKILQRRKSDLCSFRQAALLQRYGYDTSTITFKAAGEIITNLKVNGWRRLGE
jgi:superfamily II DNA or RNA helicase